MRATHIFLLLFIGLTTTTLTPCPIASADEQAPPLFAQSPTTTTGGTLASAEPIKPMDGWLGTYRGADDFVLKENADIGTIVWWGCSYDGLHGETDTIGQVLGFAVEIYENDPGADRPGKLIRREILPLVATDPRRTKLFHFGGSDIFRFSAALTTPLKVEADQKYWLCLGAYLKSKPMFCWFKSDTHNGSGVAFDYGVNGVWGDQPNGWGQKDLAFELHTGTAKREGDDPAAAPEPEAAAKVKVGAEVITGWIEKLNSRDFLTRAKAERALIEIGDEAYPILRRHADDESADPESKIRALAIIKKLGFVPGLSDTLVVHTVKKGETLGSLAKHYGVITIAIARGNTLVEGRIFPGMMLRIPTK